MIYTDSAALISAINSLATPPCYLLHTISDIKQLASALRGCCIMKVGREEVSTAHDLAQALRYSHFPFVVH